MYQGYTDKYFLRAREILRQEGINPVVRYQVFARQDIQSLEGVDEAARFIKDAAGSGARVYALRDGQEYTANEPLIKIEGRVQGLVDLETVYLGILSGRLTGETDFNEVRQKARAIKQAAEDKPVYYFGARHFGYWDDEQIAKICHEEGFAGTSTDVGARAWNKKGGGTIPHALVLSYTAHLREQGRRANPTIEAAKDFNKHIPDQVPRVVLIDTFNREIDDSVGTARALEGRLGAVRIDTCGENYAQGARNATIPDLKLSPEEHRYLKGTGVTIPAVWALRRGLDYKGFGDVGLVVSSGFNAEKTTAFMKADKVYQKKFGKPLFNSIGTGSIAKPIMTTSDICAYYSEGENQWKPLSKVGRAELPSTRLEEVR